MAKKNNNFLFRPLLLLSREQINEFVKENNILYNEDESNQEEKYLRNRIRKHVVPFLIKEGLNVNKLGKIFIIIYIILIIILILKIFIILIIN